jgi:hypothetical protein
MLIFLGLQQQPIHKRFTHLHVARNVNRWADAHRSLLFIEITLGRPEFPKVTSCSRYITYNTVSKRKVIVGIPLSYSGNAGLDSPRGDYRIYIYIYIYILYCFMDFFSFPSQMLWNYLKINHGCPSRYISHNNQFDFTSPSSWNLWKYLRRTISLHKECLLLLHCPYFCQAGRSVTNGSERNCYAF